MFIGRVRAARVLDVCWLLAVLQIECWQIVCKLRMVARWCLLCRRDSMRLDVTHALSVVCVVNRGERSRR